MRAPLYSAAERQERLDLTSLVFRALSDPNRRALLDLLYEQEQSVGELKEHLSISQPAVSQHLQVLRDAAVVSSRKECRRTIYRVSASTMVPVMQWLTKYEKFWDQRLSALGEHLKNKRK